MQIGPAGTAGYSAHGIHTSGGWSPSGTAMAEHVAPVIYNTTSCLLKSQT